MSKIPFDHYFTSKSGEATDLAREGITRGFTHIISVGGDGTAHEVVNGIAGSRVIFGMIPAGSGNDFPKAAGIPLEIPRAIEILASRSTRRVDLGLFGNQYFINGLGIGLDGAVSHRFRNMKRFRGELGYLIGAIQEALTFKSFKVEIITTAWQYRGTALLIGATNGPYHGGGFKLAPNAVVDDGLLDIYIFQDLPKLQRLIHLPKVRSGSHIELKEVEIKNAESVEINLESKIPAHMDGEPLHLEPGVHSVRVVPKALELICS